MPLHRVWESACLQAADVSRNPPVAHSITVRRFPCTENSTSLLEACPIRTGARAHEADRLNHPLRFRVPNTNPGICTHLPRALASGVSNEAIVSQPSVSDTKFSPRQVQERKEEKKLENYPMPCHLTRT